MRKLLIGKLLAVICLAVFVTACGSSPTAPTSTGGSQTSSGTPAPPAPDPTNPAPAPAPPTPVPTPSPEPSPMPGPTPTEVPTRYTAHVATVHWYGSPVFDSPDFEVLRYSDRIVIGQTTIPIVLQDEHSLVAKTQEATFSVVDSNWIFNGVAGQGSGTWSIQASK